MFPHHTFNKIFIAVITALWSINTIATPVSPQPNDNPAKNISTENIISTDRRIDITIDGAINIGPGVFLAEGNNANVSITNNAEIHLSNVLFNADYQGTLRLINNSAFYSDGGWFRFTPQENSTLQIENNGSFVMNSGFSATLGATSAFNLINKGEMRTTDNDLILLNAAQGGVLNVSNSGTMHSDNYGVLHFYPISANKISIINTGEISGARKTLFFVANNTDVNIINSGLISATDTGSFAIGVSGQKSFTLVLKQGWQIDGAVNIDDRYNSGNNVVRNNKILLSGNSDSTLSLSRFLNTTDVNASSRSAITGIHYLEKEGSSFWRLEGTQTSGGFEQVQINQGGIVLDNATLLMNDQSKLIVNNANIIVEGNSVIAGSMKNSGTVLTSKKAGTHSLIITGNYEGTSGSTLVFNATQSSDPAATGQIVIAGNATGSTFVQVNHLGGRRASAIEGAGLIAVIGNSDGEFRQRGRIVSGAYDYTLQRGKDQTATYWYLTSTLPGSESSTIRPEAGLYGTNLAAANTLFNTRLQDRLPETGEEAASSLWLRSTGSYSGQLTPGNQLNIRSNRYVAQLGSNIGQWDNNKERYLLGIMAGYARQNSHAENRNNGNRASSNISGYSAGIYATWLQNNDTHEGVYVDSWAQYNWFDNTLSGETLESENWKSSGFIAAIESGYSWQLQGSQHNGLYLQPKAQLTWMGVKANPLKEANGTGVKSYGSNNLQTRLGMRLYSHLSLDNRQHRAFQPFTEINWLHNTRKFGASLDDTQVNLTDSRNAAEIKTGVEAQFTQNVSLRGSVGVLAGGNSDRETSAMLEAKLLF